MKWINSGSSSLRTALFCILPVVVCPQVPAFGQTSLGAVDFGNLDSLSKLTATKPTDPDAWTAYGVALYGAGRMGDAVAALQHGLQLSPGEPRAKLFLALSQADMQKCQEAVPVLREAFASGHNTRLDRVTGLSLMSCLATEKNTQEAVAVAAALQQRFPGDADVLYESAELYTRLWTNAAGELMQKHPDSYRVHQLGAEVYEAQGNYDQAIREYLTALNEQPRLPGAHFRLGQLYLRKGGDEADSKASAEFRAELAQDPRSAVSALALAEIERHENQLDAAEKDYRTALAADPSLADARVGLARVLLSRHKPSEADEELKEVIATHPDNADAHYARMLCLREQGKATEATAEMQTFRALQQQKSSQFDRDLGALLTGGRTKAGQTP